MTNNWIVITPLQSLILGDTLSFFISREHFMPACTEYEIFSASRCSIDFFTNGYYIERTYSMYYTPSRLSLLGRMSGCLSKASKTRLLFVYRVKRSGVSPCTILVRKQSRSTLIFAFLFRMFGLIVLCCNSISAAM